MKTGEIYWVEFSSNSIGHEFRGKRPAVIIQSNKQIKKTNTITVMPLTGNLGNKMPDDILVNKNPANNLFKNSVVKVYYIMSFDKKRFCKKVGVVNEKVMQEISVYLEQHFDL